MNLFSFCRPIHDCYGRLLDVPYKVTFSYDQVPVDPMDYMPKYMYIGGYLDGLYSGNGQLFKKVSFGLVLYFQGLFSKNSFDTGRLFYPSQTVHYHGSFHNNLFLRGSLYKEDGTLEWEGEFLDNRPHGNGRGSFKSHSFEGVMDNGTLQSGRLHRQGSLVYEGEFRDNFYHGLGRTPTDLGDYEKGVLVYGTVFKLPAAKKTFNGIFIHRYVGSFENNQWHGPGTLFFKLLSIDDDTRYYKFTGQFVCGKLHGCADIYETSLDDPLLCTTLTGLKYPFSGVSRTHGTLLGTADYHHNIHTGDITLLREDGIQYCGAGRVFCHDQVLVKHGPGTAFVHGKMRFQGLFDSNVLIHVTKVYDETTRLLFEAIDGPTHLEGVHFLDADGVWPAVSGRGKVFSADGRYLYTGSFLDGKLLCAAELIDSMPSLEVFIQDVSPVDYISFEKLHVNDSAVVITDLETNQKPISVSSFLRVCESVLKDPVRGAYPGLRFQKIVLKDSV